MDTNRPHFEAEYRQKLLDKAELSVSLEDSAALKALEQSEMDARLCEGYAKLFAACTAVEVKLALERAINNGNYNAAGVALKELLRRGYVDVVNETLGDLVIYDSPVAKSLVNVGLQHPEGADKLYGWARVTELFMDKRAVRRMELKLAHPEWDESKIEMEIEIDGQFKTRSMNQMWAKGVAPDDLSAGESSEPKGGSENEQE
ncbi:MAG: hypothetical protein LBQ02_00555 [Candidatus Nomurabacteria bacterium]|nr:hypothetical protein [Candidatus Nomurabacteria bacterium]